jgi:hypothetical protein
MTKREPWVCPPVHPAAALLPMMSDTELAELADDIKANGVQQPIAVHCFSKSGTAFGCNQRITDSAYSSAVRSVAPSTVSK